eukprot:435747-Pyramimonas_sp.AAC.1
MSGGRPALPAYADNINLLGSDAQRTGKMRDELVDHFRSIGFVVHEITGPSVDAVTLGDKVMGREKLVVPTDRKLELLRAAGLWLLRRPRVSGKALE